MLLIWPYNLHARKRPELFPIGLGYLLTSLQKNGLYGHILDCCVRDLPPDSDDFKRELVLLRPNVVGISWWSNNTPMVKQTIRVVKQVLPQACIVSGGPHPTAYGDALLSAMSELDFLFFGEAEEGFPKLGRLLSEGENGTNTIDFSLLGDIPGLIYRNDKGSVRKNKQSFEKNLDALGAIDYDLLQLATYQSRGYSYGGKAIRDN
uniref:B12 binding domain-containing protein n=2 Tax=Candidatus Kentrum eta TaxID=2126337 RepID=A0A450UJP9_9GAMM|nr:MAG: B12 binding domain-containing protein [Candidatus Kentron sp. H]